MKIFEMTDHRAIVLTLFCALFLVGRSIGELINDRRRK
jgi:hypothetical protein